MSADRGGLADLAAVFIGPKGENADIFEQLLLDAFRDHISWRRDFHPEDGRVVSELDKQDPAYDKSISILRRELARLLAELKAGVPAFSPRYVGHMCSDLTMASLIGYFATMLYNPNNVAAESSPVTSKMELEVAAQLAAMLGYPAETQWGHLTSGGTVANFEAIWMARNVKYLPVALHWASIESAVSIDIRLADGTSAPIGDLSLWDLLNIPPAAALDAADHFRAAFPYEQVAADALARHSLAGLGYQEFGRRLAREFGDALPPAVVLVPSTGHYSWEKICRSLGIGGSNLVLVPVDRRFRTDVDALEKTLRSLRSSHTAVIACIAVVGTTEESAVDPVDRVADLRDSSGPELGLAFHLHADAAYGGYAAAITRLVDGTRAPLPEAAASDDPPWPERQVFTALCALERTDSVTIDPHKLGFIPYPAGAICMRDARARDLVAIEAPYVFHRGQSEWGYIGRYIFEGSKPGAAASAVWLSHKVLPLDQTGYGRLIGETARAARRLHESLTSTDWRPFRLVTLPSPDLNIVCFSIGHPALTSLGETNDFVDRVYRRMSVQVDRPRTASDYFVTKTVLRAAQYGDSVLPILDVLGFTAEEYGEVQGLSVIRCTVMDPFMARAGGTDHIAGFGVALRTCMEEALRPPSPPR